MRWCACSRSSPPTPRRASRPCGRRRTRRCATRSVPCSRAGRCPPRPPAPTAPPCRGWRAPRRPPRADGEALEPDRVVAMALEVGVAGPRLTATVDAVARGGRLTRLLDALDEAPESGAAEVVRRHVATADMVARFVADEAVDLPAPPGGGA